jgi:hypothetical protein
MLTLGILIIRKWTQYMDVQHQDTQTYSLSIKDTHVYPLGICSLIILTYSSKTLRKLTHHRKFCIKTHTKLTLNKSTQIYSLSVKTHKNGHNTRTNIIKLFRCAFKAHIYSLSICTLIILTLSSETIRK